MKFKKVLHFYNSHKLVRNIVFNLTRLVLSTVEQLTSDSSYEMDIGTYSLFSIIVIETTIDNNNVNIVFEIHNYIFAWVVISTVV